MMKKHDDIEKKNIFKTPEGYFDQLPDRIQARIAEESKETKHVKVSWGIRYAAAAAIALVIGYFVIFQDILVKPPENTADLLEEVSTDQLVAYLENSEYDDYISQVRIENMIEEGDIDEEAFDEIFSVEQDFLNDLESEDDELLLEIDEWI